MTKIVIIEDEMPAFRLLRGMLEKLRPQWKLVAHHDSVADAVNWLENNAHPDIIFMDIQLSDGLSFNILDQIKVESFVIFTTAFDEYAIQAFKVNSIDYLLKPFDEEVLEKALTKYEQLTENLQHRNTDSIRVDELIASIRMEQKLYRTRFLINYRDMLYTLPVSDIAYFYSENRVTCAVAHNGKEHVVDYTLDKLSEQLDPNLFFRANRSTLVHIDSIKQISPYFKGKIVVTLQPPAKTKVTVSREKASTFKRWLNY
ncbi:DNA-binding response regulator [Marinilabiliaceae bacterium JC017]|nr:DNA-binding response regulator [Marinilabiliaceae bacterium JC017]